MSAPTVREAPGTATSDATRWGSVRQWLAHPVAPYYLLIGSAGLLLAIGLLLVTNKLNLISA